MRDPGTGDMVAALPGLIERVARRLLGEPNRRLSRADELRFGNRGSVSVIPLRGVWHDHAAGTGGGVLELIRRETGHRGREAIDWLRSELGAVGGSAENNRPPPSDDHARAPESARCELLAAHGRALWAACPWITSANPAGRYLAARGCALPHPEGDLRWHPALRHPCGHVGPALVGLVTDVLDASRWLTLHRTWITGDRSGRKADVDPPRLLLKGHRKAGGVVRLWPDCEVTLGLGLAEGIENALVLARGFQPVWAAIDAGNLAALPYLYPIEALTVAVDHDPAGQRAYAALAERWTAAGAEVRGVLAPRPGDDLNDWCAGIDDAA